MREQIREQLKRSGWGASPRYKGFLHTRRGGIEWDLGQPRQGVEDRLELRYRYVTEHTNAEGTVDLAATATPEQIGDAMTTIYLRVHERPDPTRTFGGRPSRRGAPGSVPSAAPPPPEPAEAGQTELDL